MKTTGQLLDEKGHAVWSVSPETSVFEALSLMAEKDVGALLVLEEGQLVGIFSERDYARKVILKGKSSREMVVKEIMSPGPTVVDPEVPVEDSMSLMMRKHFRHLPVMDDGQLLGIISVTDVVSAIILEQKAIIEQLESYIREKNQYSEALKRREAELSAIFDATVDGIVTVDSQRIIDSFNPAAARIFGYQPTEVIGQDIRKLIVEEASSDIPGYDTPVKFYGVDSLIGKGRELLGRRKDGSTFPLHLAFSALQHGEKARYTGIVRDLTDVKRMQRKVLQASTLAAIGEMAASIAHEIKNPLAGIGGAIQVLADTVPGDDPRKEVMTEILGQVARLDKTVRQLLMLSKQWIPAKQRCDVEELLSRILDGIRKQDQFRNMRFMIRKEGPVRAQLDPSLFEQVIWNLLTNAADAMPSGGEVEFILGQTNEAASVTVRDNGPGVSPEVLRKLFRPFFTTKTRGTGLGLSICKKIVDAHEGSIHIESELGRGTRISMVFPSNA